MKHHLERSARALAFAAWLPVAAGCGEEANLEPAKPSGITVQAQAVPTVIQVSWSTQLPSMGYVEYGLTPAMEYSTPMQADANFHTTRLLGLAANSTYYYRIVTWQGNDAGASEVSTLQTGAFPVTLPTFQVEGKGVDRSVVVPLVNTSTVVILNPAGTVVWAYQDTSGLQVTRARLSLDKLSVLYNTVGPAGTPTPNAAVVRVSLDGTAPAAVTVPDMGADFVELPDGAIAVLAPDVRDMGGTPVRGDKIVEVRGGVATDVWSTWDCFDPALVPGDNIAEAWTGANALDYDDDNDVYYVGLQSFSSIVKVNRAARMCEWVLGTSGATLTADGTPFVHQHQFEVNGSTVVVLDNEGAGANASRVLKYSISPTDGTATQSAVYAPATPLSAGTFGEASLVPGFTFVNWGAAGVLEQIDSMSMSQWRLTAVGTVFGYHDVPTSLYDGSGRLPK